MNDDSPRTSRGVICRTRKGFYMLFFRRKPKQEAAPCAGVHRFYNYYDHYRRQGFDLQVARNQDRDYVISVTSRHRGLCYQGVGADYNSTLMDLTAFLVKQGVIEEVRT